MSETIEGGIVLDFLKKLVNQLGKGFDWMDDGKVDLGNGESFAFEVVKVTEYTREEWIETIGGDEEDESFDTLESVRSIYAKVGDEYDMSIVIFDEGVSGKVTVSIFAGTANNPREIQEVKIVPTDQVKNKVIEFVKGHFPDAVAGDLEAVDMSKAVHIRLTPVAGSSDLELSAVYCAYDASLANSVIDDVLGDPDFAEALPGTEVCYSIMEDDSGYDVEEVEGLPAPDQEDEHRWARELLTQQYSTLFALQRYVSLRDDTKAVRLLIESQIDDLIDLGVISSDDMAQCQIDGGESALWESSLPADPFDPEMSPLVPYIDALSTFIYYELGPLQELACQFLVELCPDTLTR